MLISFQFENLAALSSNLSILLSCYLIVYILPYERFTVKFEYYFHFSDN